MAVIFEGCATQVLIAPDPDAIQSVQQPEVRVTWAGFEGDRHAGLTYRSGGRTPQFPRGTELRNTRQVSILSTEELTDIAAAMGIPAILPEWLGANLLIESIPALTLLPPSTRLYFPGDAVLVVEGENFPCTSAGEVIQQQYPTVDGLTTGFPKAGLHKRGVVAWVERPGVIQPGDAVRVELPDVTPYPAGNLR